MEVMNLCLLAKSEYWLCLHVLLEGMVSLANTFIVGGLSGFCVSQFCICVKSISRMVHAGGYLGGVWGKKKGTLLLLVLMVHLLCWTINLFCLILFLGINNSWLGVHDATTTTSRNVLMDDWQLNLISKTKCGFFLAPKFIKDSLGRC